MSILGKQHFQELPLLPGEMEFLKSRGWTRQFGEFEHRVIDFPLDAGTMKLEFLVGRSKTCACEHDTRTTACRLYPLLPIYDLDGRVVGVDTRFGMFEEVESIDQTERACKIDQVPFSELGKFVTIANAIAQNPTHHFYVMAFRLAKVSAVQRLRATRQCAAPNISTLRIFEGLFALKQLLDPNIIRPQLNDLADQFKRRHRERFTVA
jgi:hypothetical protein